MGVKSILWFGGHKNRKKAAFGGPLMNFNGGISMQVGVFTVLGEVSIRSLPLKFVLYFNKNFPVDYVQALSYQSLIGCSSSKELLDFQLSKSTARKRSSHCKIKMLFFL